GTGNREQGTGNREQGTGNIFGYEVRHVELLFLIEENYGAVRSRSITKQRGKACGFAPDVYRLWLGY
ncbi:MAG: hypothetical protein WDZ30_02090, partial [Cellvibrionaceae bacterium]